MDLYNKYRPTRFEDMFPTSPIIQALPTLIKRVLDGDDDALPKAMLFYSEEYGTGKTTTARLIPRDLNPHLTDAEKEALLRGNDVSVCKTINGARFRGIADMSAIDEEIRYFKDPLMPVRMVYIIDEAHKITPDAQDLLLKTIEDLGSAPVYIILTSSQYSKNNSALLTRVQKYFFRSLTEDELVSLVLDVAKKENVVLDEKTARDIAAFSEGSARDALSRLGQYILTRSLGPGSTDNLLDEVSDAVKLVDMLILLCDKDPSITWRSVVTVLRSALTKTRADELRINMLKAAIRRLENPPRVKDVGKFTDGMAHIVERIMQPISYPEHTYMSAMVYLLYNTLKKM